MHQPTCTLVLLLRAYSTEESSAKAPIHHTHSDVKEEQTKGMTVPYIMYMPEISRTFLPTRSTKYVAKIVIRKLTVTKQRGTLRTTSQAIVRVWTHFRHWPWLGLLDQTQRNRRWWWSTAWRCWCRRRPKAIYHKRWEWDVHCIITKTITRETDINDWH